MSCRRSVLCDQLGFLNNSLEVARHGEGVCASYKRAESASCCVISKYIERSFFVPSSLGMIQRMFDGNIYSRREKCNKFLLVVVRVSWSPQITHSDGPPYGYTQQAPCIFNCIKSLVVTITYIALKSYLW